jgi:PTS system nitrogen regulatory IIA component
MKDNLFQLFIDQPLCSRDEVYQFISEKLFPENPIEALQIKEALYEREKNGNIQIDEKVVLPHIENASVKETAVLIIQPRQPIKNWQPEIPAVELIIAVLLPEQETDTIKRQLADFMRKLADPEFLSQLQTTKESEAMKQLLN